MEAARTVVIRDPVAICVAILSQYFITSWFTTYIEPPWQRPTVLATPCYTRSCRSRCNVRRFTPGQSAANSSIRSSALSKRSPTA